MIIVVDSACSKPARTNQVSISETRTVQLLSTQLHEIETKQLVEDFELAWHGIDSKYDETSILSQVAMGPFLDYWQPHKGSAIESEPISALVEATVLDIAVLEYSSQKIKVLANVERAFANFAGENMVSETPTKHRRCTFSTFR